MPDFAIHAVPVAGGTLAVSSLPGRVDRYEGDVARLIAWDPQLVISICERHELARGAAQGLGDDLAACGIEWRHMAVPDHGVPDLEAEAAWPDLATIALGRLFRGGRVLIHCYGGCGRSGMAVLRLMVEAGEAPATALARLRGVRPCAVENDTQYRWAASAA